MKILGDIYMGGFQERRWHIDARAEEMPLGGAGTCHPKVSRFCGFTFSTSWAECFTPLHCLPSHCHLFFLPPSWGPSQTTWIGVLRGLKGRGGGREMS